MLQLFKLSFEKRFSSRRNGASTLEEAEETKPDRKVVDVEKDTDVRQETNWDAKVLDAKDLEARAAVKFNM